MSETEVYADPFCSIRFHDLHGAVEIKQRDDIATIVKILTDASPNYDKGTFLAVSFDALNKPKSRSEARCVGALLARENAESR